MVAAFQIDELDTPLGPEQISLGGFAPVAAEMVAHVDQVFDRDGLLDLARLKVATFLNDEGLFQAVDKHVSRIAHVEVFGWPAVPDQARGNEQVGRCGTTSHTFCAPEQVARVGREGAQLLGTQHHDDIVVRDQGVCNAPLAPNAATVGGVFHAPEFPTGALIDRDQVVVGVKVDASPFGRQRQGKNPLGVVSPKHLTGVDPKGNDRLSRCLAQAAFGAGCRDLSQAED